MNSKPEFRMAYSWDEDWARAAKTCADGIGRMTKGSGLGFIYVTESLAGDISSILTYLRQTTMIIHWVGGVGTGVFAGSEDCFDQPGVAVMAGTFPEESFRIFSTVSTEKTRLPFDLRQWPSGLQEWINQVSCTFGVVHGDPTSTDLPHLIEDLSEATSGFLVGGLTSPQNAETSHVAEKVTGGGLSGVLFSPMVEVATGLTQGCSPIGENHLVSDCLDNVIIGLDGRRAVDVLKEDAADLLARDPQHIIGNVHISVPIQGSDTGEYMVRALLGIDPMRGWLAVAGTIDPGDRVMFVCRDRKSAEKDLVAMAKKLKKRLPGRPKGGLYFSCVGRGPSLFGGQGRETAMIRDILGDFPLVGFHAGGEISNGRIYAYTGILALFL
jgi:small ligand-binding sensory domain FIST